MIRNNEIVFIDVTADWCATCQFNKLNVLENKKLRVYLRIKILNLLELIGQSQTKILMNFLKNIINLVSHSMLFFN